MSEWVSAMQLAGRRHKFPRLRESVALRGSCYARDDRSEKVTPRAPCGRIAGRLQGRFPIRVELDSLGRAELVRILTEPESSLVRQYQALLGTEGIELVFTPDGISAVAEVAEEVNRRTENIGARRLHTVMERVLEDVSFAGAETEEHRVVVDASYVRHRVADIASDTDLSRFIL